ncbi:AAA family ATPase [Deinococcus arenicola]|uniref:Metallophosphoesterase n=1 Tax=Deinococcus arenicola TaxID=2994950 RepID=A0ABU4DU86_9DEIO|nr:AAA family ATPase [Deinococcus sp. ZS9-10]MDV6375986.1 metallophosphoesterase [Deinococcus sp. ZS9-10]
MNPPPLPLPSPAVIALIGAPGSGKSTFAARHFGPEEVLSGDFSQELEGRLSRGELTVVDAPLTHPDGRRRVLEASRAHDLPAVAVVLDPPRQVLEERAVRAGLDPAALLPDFAELRRTLSGLQKEGFRQVYVLHSVDEIDAAQIVRVPLPPDRRDLPGPFDFIGDVHGCLPELLELLAELGYSVSDLDVTPPAGRTAVFLGDLTDRGPDSAGVLRVAMGMAAAGTALCVPGNHDEKLARALDGKAVKAMHGLDGTLAQLDAAGEDFKTQVRAFIGTLPSHLVLDGGRVVVAHAGLPTRYQGRMASRVRSFALYGDVDGSRDELGLPIRRDWAAQYRGAAIVVYGHTPIAAPVWINRTVDIDTGCAFGNALTALRYPELEFVSVPARQMYVTPPRSLPLLGPGTGTPELS